MSDLKKQFIKLMEDVDMDYKAPFDANSGQGITKFAPTPASKVLKSYQVDGDFLRKALSYGGVEPNAVDQIMGGIDGQQVDGPLGGSHFDTVMGAFGSAAGLPPIAGGDVVPPMGSGAGMAPDAVPPMDDGGPVDAGVAAGVDIEPVASDIGAGEPAVPGVPTEPEMGGEEIPVDAGAGSAIGGVGTGSPVDGQAPEGVEPTDGVEDAETDKQEEPGEVA